MRPIQKVLKPGPWILGDIILIESNRWHKVDKAAPSPLNLSAAELAESETGFKSLRTQPCPPQCPFLPFQPMLVVQERGKQS